MMIIELIYHYKIIIINKMIKLFILLIIFLPFCNNLIINIGATGLLLPYTLGVLGYIKDHSTITRYNSKFIGTSGGAYCSILYCFENNLIKQYYIVLKITYQITIIFGIFFLIIKNQKFIFIKIYILIKII